MPYTKVKLKGGKVEVKNSKTGKVHAKGTTAAKAAGQERLLNAIEHNPDFKPYSKK